MDTFTTNGSGVIASTANNTNLGIDLPTANDWNKVANPNCCRNANYSAPDNYATCHRCKNMVSANKRLQFNNKGINSIEPDNLPV